MSGAQISDSIDDRAVTLALDRLRNKMADPQPVLEEIGEAMVSSTKQRFIDSRDPAGRKWKRLAYDTVLGRLGGRRKAFTKRGRLRAAARRKLTTGGGIKPLINSGDLLSSIDRQVRGNEVIVGSDMKYAAIHQFGGKAGRGRKVTIPARPFLGLSGDDEREVRSILARRIEGAA